MKNTVIKREKDQANEHDSIQTGADRKHVTNQMMTAISQMNTLCSKPGQQQ